MPTNGRSEPAVSPPNAQPLLPSSNRTIYVGDARSGTLWRPTEWKKVMAGYIRNGTILRLCNAAQPDRPRILKGQPTHKSSSTTSQQRTVAFACTCYSREMATLPPVDPIDSTNTHPIAPLAVFYSFVLCAIDQRGHIYAIDFVANKFWIIARTGVAASAVCFNSVRRREIVVAMADRTIHCYNIDNCQLIAKLPVVHQAAVHCIAVHPTRPLAISTSCTESVLWDTENWERKRILVGSTSGMQQACFSQDGLSIVAAFEDGSIFFWMVDSFTLQWKITLDQMADVVPDAEAGTKKLLSSQRFLYFAISTSGEFFAYSGISSTVYIWNIFERRLMHEILIPAFRETLILQIAFVGTSNIIALLSDTGVLIFINASEAKFVGHLQGRHVFHSFSLSPDGSILSCILMDAKHTISTVRLDDILYPKLSQLDNRTDTMTDMSDDFTKKLEITKPMRNPVTVEQPMTFYQLVESKEESCMLNRRKLSRFLTHYGEYASQYRTLIWRFLLKLPENRAGYEALLDQNVHPNFRDFRKLFPLKSDRQAKAMERVLSCLAFWSPIFANLDYLPAMVFPFVTLFSNDLFSGFEVVMTVINMIEEMISYHDPELLAHFIKCNVTSQVYAWTMMQSLFSEVFSRPDWLKLWDHLLTQPPSFMYHFVIAYITTFRVSLLDITELADFKFFFQRRNAANFTRIILKAYHFRDTTPNSVAPSTVYRQLSEPDEGEIRSDEAEYLRKRRMADELARLTDDLKRDKKAWDSADWKMDQMVEKWWEQMMGEEDMRMESKAKLDTLEKEKRATAMRQISEARRAFVDQQISTTEQHIANISRAIGHTSRAKSHQHEQKDLEVAFGDIENEWLKRRDEMVHMRGKISALQHERVQRLARHAEDSVAQ
ncbi:hypothetical protein BASA60_007519 [Batrachochytrium salamandrivorans]|nr:hypothetical protein BASA60_007519 [Batrachochytrium salamandrivorans]